MSVMNDPILTPTSTPPVLPSPSNNAYLMNSSPRKRGPATTYKPEIITTIGVRPACLVNASVTYVGKDQIYAFGGFDQYTDEVYNHVLRLDLHTRQWYLVDNYGDIPGVRMGHTACLWQNDKLLVYAGENEHRAYLNDVIIFDLNTAHWTQPKIHGIPPRGRARHAAFIHDDKLWVSGGMSGPEATILDDIFFLDLKTWTWSKVWRFVRKHDHTIWFWSGRIYSFGGMNEEMEKKSNLWWVDLRSHTSAKANANGNAGVNANANPNVNSKSTSSPQKITSLSLVPTANSSSVQQATYNPTPQHLGPISMLSFVSSSDLPSQSSSQHFHVYTSGYLLDFVTPSDIPSETSLSALDLSTLKWHRIAEGRDMFKPNYQWHYCTLNENGTQAWLLGHSPEPSFTRNENSEEFLSDVLHISLEKLGVLGNGLHQSLNPVTENISSGNVLSAIGADLSSLFDKSPESGAGTDFQVIAEADDESNWSQVQPSTFDTIALNEQASKPIHVHRLILQARWPHFAHVWNSQMREYHTGKLLLPEPYSTVRAFLYYLYTDTISSQNSGADLSCVAGMLVMANMYDMSRLRALCVERLAKELSVEHAATVWDRASVAGEEWLRRRATRFCSTNWGRIVRTEAFRALSQESLVELCEEVADEEGRVVTGNGVAEVVEPMRSGGAGATATGAGVNAFALAAATSRRMLASATPEIGTPFAYGEVEMSE